MAQVKSKRRSVVSRRARIEADALGKVKIPARALYGPSTQRAVENFPVSGWRLNRRFIFALGLIKHSAAKVNHELGLLPRDASRRIMRSAALVRDGTVDDQFVVDVFQTGSGTSTNMNANEVIATLANEEGRRKGARAVHPNDHVNMGQSSNDVIPSAMHVAALLELKDDLLPQLVSMRQTLLRKKREFWGVITLGRTHLQDATPIRLGQAFGGYAMQIEKTRASLAACLPSLRELALGGTAVGTGVNTHPRFSRLVCRELNRALKERFREASDHFEAQSSRTAMLDLSGRLRALAVSLEKIAQDIRWLGSGPRAGLGELVIPAVQPGSSIMPGKVNPVMAETLLQVCHRVVGNDLTVARCAQSGNFQLNTAMPLLAHTISESLRLLSNGIRLFNEKCLAGIKADRNRTREHAQGTLMLATALVPRFGYRRAGEIAHEAHAKGVTILQLVQDQGLLPAREARQLLDPRNLVEPVRGKDRSRR